MALNERQQLERDDVTLRLTEDGPHTLLGDRKLVFFAQLMRQLESLYELREAPLCDALLGVGIEERLQNYEAAPKVFEATGRGPLCWRLVAFATRKTLGPIRRGRRCQTRR